MKRLAALAFLIAAGLDAPAAEPDDASAAAASSGIYVAVGYGGRRMSSHDGITWENVQEWIEKGGDDSNNLISLAFGLGKFVAVGGGGWSRDTQAGHILVSTDGKEWRETLKLANRISPVMFGEGRFVAGGPDKTLYWSTDGEKWQSGAKIDYQHWAFWFRQGTFGNGVFAFIGNSGSKQTEHWCARTSDGTSITSFKADLPPVNGIAFGTGRFVVVGKDGLRMSSRDAESWEHSADAPGEDLSYVVWSGKEFLAGGGKSAFTSPDGITWQPAATKPPCSVLYADARVFIGSSWPGQMWSSPDGQVWKKGAQLPPNGINKVAFGVVGSR